MGNGFSQFTYFFQPYYGIGFDLASNISEYHESSFGSKTRPARKADNPTAIYEPIVLDNVGFSTSHNPIDLHGLLRG
jgi:hypothetical protein